MSDDAPTRQIAGLTPRTSGPDLSRLQARNRPSPTLSASTPPSAADEAAAPVQSSTLERPAAPASAAAVGESKRMTTYVTTSTRERAKSAFLATRHLEGDDTWSGFVERAILTEVERRETKHNEGHPYEVDHHPLPVGRPLR
ncbi:hypothetical protein [Cryobacterium sp. Y11]|uniref:ParB family protein n=1 Tax=Cryobacterium sp. Y11 TaxID=2045016 RepID=UPI0011B0622C|nr:hypothetical protein [Cryobacterium sp. Y11]